MNQWEGTLSSTSSTTSIVEEVMAEEIIFHGPCVNSPSKNGHIIRPKHNARNPEMKNRLLQIFYANPFSGLDHGDPYTHLTKFYEIIGTLGALEAEEEQVFMRSFPYSLIGSSESLYEGWERYKSMLRRFPNHGFDDLTQIHIFHNGLQSQQKLLLDATTGGSLMSKSAEDEISINDQVTLNDHQVQHNREPS
ncbi:uncharacterized protein LOC131659185 [Vicia villosa]|uniref:uncharacterized protein LOC131659185 n=1 Tax=Vicia villosa TaxID=3911 RepID=UPI00273BDBA9|nr:uncharacterized protein LOC131659185 [Vicia villosa]